METLDKMISQVETSASIEDAVRVASEFQSLKKVCLTSYSIEIYISLLFQKVQPLDGWNLNDSWQIRSLV